MNIEHKLNKLLEDRLWHDHCLRIETYRDAQRELRMEWNEIFERYVIYHDIQDQHEAFRFAGESEQLRANLTIALCLKFWSDSSRPWLQKYEERLKPLIPEPDHAFEQP